MICAQKKPRTWETITLAECLERVEQPVNLKADEIYTQIGIRSHGKGLFYKEPVTGKQIGNKSVYWIVPDCFILNIVFAWEQAIGKTTKNEIGMIGSHRFPMYRPRKDKIDIDYLLYYFLTKRGTDLLKAASPGGAGRNRTLGQTRFLKSRIPLPPLEEQKKIAAILSTQNKIIELKEKLLAEKQQQKKYLMQQLLTGKKRLPGFSGTWKTYELNQLCAYSKQSTTVKNGMYITTETMKDGYSGIIENEPIGETKGIQFSKGNILISNIRPYLKKVWLSDREGVCSADVLVLIANPLVSPEYLYCLVARDEFVKYVMQGVKGSKMPRGDKKQILKMKVALPLDSVECKSITNMHFKMTHEIELLQKSIEAEKLKKKALMQLLLTGIVRVEV